MRIALLAGLCLLPLAGCARLQLDDLGPVGDFKLNDRSGKVITQDDLKGKVWVASFVFVRCTSHCPQITATVRELQSQLRNVKDVRFVTFTVDPAHDHEKELAEYAEKFQADPEKWLFLTGDEAVIKRLHREQFKMDVTPDSEGGELMHSTKLVLVDRNGHIRAEPGRIAYDGMVPESLRQTDPKLAVQEEQEERAKIRAAVHYLASPSWDFPLFHAALNSLATVLLIVGGLAIKFRAIRLHIACMLTTLGVSTLFLASYLYYHLVVKASVATRFVDQNPDAPAWAAYLYYAILGSHTLLAVIITPLALWTAYLGWTNQLPRHRPLAKWVLPLWLYVTVTGVLVYVLLYRVYS
jgi:protein SCO1/2/putative membrane protein